MVQLAPKAVGTTMGHTSHVHGMTYAYDIAHRGGLAMPTLDVADIDGASVGNRVGKSVTCPVGTGACVSSVTGGVVKGIDMYGQTIRETLAAAGTSKIAFFAIHSAPADVRWVNEFGLPYKYSAAAADPTAGVTITPPAADGDARGTFTVTDPAVGRVEVRYMADQTNLMGDPYSTRFATP